MVGVRGLELARSARRQRILEVRRRRPVSPVDRHPADVAVRILTPGGYVHAERVPARRKDLGQGGLRLGRRLDRRSVTGVAGGAGARVPAAPTAALAGAASAGNGGVAIGGWSSTAVVDVVGSVVVGSSAALPTASPPAECTTRLEFPPLRAIAAPAATAKSTSAVPASTAAPRRSRREESSAPSAVRRSSPGTEEPADRRAIAIARLAASRSTQAWRSGTLSTVCHRARARAMASVAQSSAAPTSPSMR